ncbi:hypothetical protein C8J56DRAFT_921338 [Mycena floridula]|nr:hypothetical protein C8J56DRAFT_921338 [Mycena floridula]
MADEFYDWLETLHIGPTGQTQKLDVTIVGAGVTGLISAIGFGLYGHSVTVVEKDPKDVFFKPDPTGIRCTPGLSRLFTIDPGIIDYYCSDGTLCRGITYLNDTTAETIGKIEFSPDLMKDLGADIYLIRHDMLRKVNIELCERIGVKMRWGSKAISVDTSNVSSGGQVDVTFEDGSHCSTDIVLGCDGYHSTIRSFVVDEVEEDEDCIAVLSGANVTTPIEGMLKDPDLVSLCESDHINVWMGDKSSIIGASHGSFYDLCFTSTHNHHGRSEFERTKEFTIEDFSTFNILNYEPRIRKIVELASSAHFTTQHIREPDSLSDKSSRIILLGDACRQTPLPGMHNVSMGAEDASALSGFFNYLTDISQIPLLVQASEQTRGPRREAIQREMLDIFDMESLEPGAAREKRDTVLRHAKGEEEGGMLLRYVSQFNYDALDAVHEWWVNWGKHMVEMNGPGASAGRH